MTIQAHSFRPKYLATMFFLLLAVCLAIGLSVPTSLLEEAKDPPISFGDATKAEAEAIRRSLKDNVAPFWIYENISEGVKQAKDTGKPLLVYFR